MIRSFKVVLVLSWLAVVEKLIQIENDQQEVVTHQLNMHFLNNTIKGWCYLPCLPLYSKGSW